MKNPHKQQICLNCNFTFDKPDNFCPNCGQENTDYHLSAKEMLKELIQSTFNFDSKLAHSAVPFLFKPGFLPRAFMEGKRKHYVHPVRFYLFISLIFFFIFSQSTSNLFNAPSDSHKSKLLSKSEVDSALSQTTHFIELAARTGQLDSAQAVQINQSIQGLDSKELFTKNIKELNAGNDSLNFSIGGKKTVTESWRVVSEVWLQDPNMTPDILLDSLHFDEKPWLLKKIAHQAIKYGRSNDPRLWQREIFDNIPIMMFLLLPIFATILKLVYIRSKRWYIEHLVFTFHIHSYAFFIISIVMLLSKSNSLEDYALAGGAITLLIYPYLMFKNYYEQGLFKTLIKFWFVGFMYFFLLIFALLLELFVSFMMF